MSVEHRMVKLTDEKTCCWKLGRRDTTGRWQSRFFSISNTLNPLCFIIEANKNDIEYGKFYLCEKTEGASNIYYLRIEFKSKSQAKEILIQTVKCIKVHNWNMYYLEEIRTRYLLEITCRFLTARDFIESFEGTSKKGIHDENEDIFSKIKHEDESVDNEIAHKGLTVLSEDLKDAFLCDKDSDVNLQVGNKTYPAHKVIITTRSPVFRAMLEHDMKEKNEGIVYISDCDPNIFQDFLFYIYTGKVDHITNENVFELYHISDKYDVKVLQEACISFIVKNLSVDIICDVFSLALKYCRRDVLTCATKFFVTNAKDVLETSNWQIFLKKYPVQANELFLKTLNKLSHTSATRRNQK